MVISISLLYFFNIEKIVFAWHGEMGITNTRAEELWMLNPDDPVITQWKLGLQIQKDDTILACDNPTDPPLPNKNGNVTQEQWDVYNQLEESRKEFCNQMMDTLVTHCITHDFMQLISCEDSRVQQKINEQKIN